MSRSRPDTVARLLLGAFAGVVASACASVGAHRTDWNHPAELVGSWVDVTKSTPSDTSLWLLDASGEDGSQHVRATRSADAAPTDFALTSRKLYGYWYLHGTLADTTDRRICYLNHSGRFTGHCTAFQLDTVTTAQGPRRRLHLHGYIGLHTTMDRILIAREP